MHETAEEAKTETEQMLRVYVELCENELSTPMIKGRKTDEERLAGAEMTYTIETMMHDGKALQSGTSRYFGDGFARAFDTTFQDRDNSVCYPHQTSWGLSTRIIGGIIMTHGNNDGLVLPPAIVSIQVVIVPVAQHKEDVLEKARELEQRLKKVCRVLVDGSDQSLDWKFAQYEVRGVPIRLEIGPKDIEKDQCVLVRRTDREKSSVFLADLEQAVLDQLETVRRSMYDMALSHRENMTYTIKTLDEFREVADQKPGFVKAIWYGSPECEEKLRDLAGVSSRCTPFEQEQITETCVCCGQKAKAVVYWGKAY